MFNCIICGNEVQESLITGRIILRYDRLKMKRMVCYDKYFTLPAICNQDGHIVTKECTQCKSILIQFEQDPKWELFCKKYYDILYLPPINTSHEDSSSSCNVLLSIAFIKKIKSDHSFPLTDDLFEYYSFHFTKNICNTIHHFMKHPYVIAKLDIQNRTLLTRLDNKIIYL